MKPILALSENPAYTKALERALTQFEDLYQILDEKQFKELVLNPGFSEQASLVLFDPASGPVPWEIVRKLKASHETRAVPVIAVSSRSDEAHRYKLLAMDVHEYFAFPFSRREFVLRCERAIEAWHEEKNWKDGVRLLRGYRQVAEKTDVEKREMQEILAAQEAVIELGRQERQEIDSIRNAQEAVFEMSRQELMEANEKLRQSYEAKLEAVREKSELQMMFGKYIAPEVIEVLMRQDGLQRLAGEKQDVSVLFADIRGFTSLCDEMPPHKVILLLNEFFTELTETILEHHGIIDKYSGDNIIAIFGAPAELPYHEQAAVLAAIGMQEKFSLLKESWKSIYRADAGLGIGINFGQAIVGNVGCYHKISYTAIGDVVNIAARFEQIARDGEIIIGENLRERMSDDFLARNGLTLEAQEPVTIRGKKGLHTTWNIRQERV